ncbi:MAG: diaminopimelate decarboxylase [bacterium]|nr:diaminopimelate decarboxylase [bacterium]
MKINNVSVSSIAEKYGTPVFVYDEARIRENYRRLEKAFSSKYDNFKIYYSVKANSNPSLIKILLEEGAGVDASCQNEIKLATCLGVKGEDIIFSGNFLTGEDIQEGLSSKALFNLDDISLLPKVLAFGKPEVLSFRINPGMGKSNVGHFDITGGPEAKFGLNRSQAVEAYKQAKNAGIERFGIHMMAGSCVTDHEYFAEITERLFDVIGEIKKELDIDFEFVDLGGGLGIPYKPDEHPLDLEKAVEGMVRVIKNKCTEFGIELPKIVIEPGRYLVADAGYLIGKVLLKKESYKEIWGTNLSMNLVPRVILYDAYHEFVIDCKEEQEKAPTFVCGQVCEQTDLWGKELMLPKLEVGDLIVMKNTGAYCFVMSYDYNGRLLPAEILIKADGTTEVIREAKTFEDTLRGTQVGNK